MSYQFEMSDQLGLFGIDPVPPTTPAAKKARPPRKMHKLFFALKPDAEDAQAFARYIRELDRQHFVGGQLLRVDRLHITLQVVGEFDETPEPIVQVMRQVGDAVVANVFDISFDRAMYFQGARAYVLAGGEGVQTVRDFHQNLCAEIGKVLPFKAPSLTPHMTMSYGGRVVAEHAIEPIRWTARELLLIDSHVGKTYHEVVGSWSLRP